MLYQTQMPILVENIDLDQNMRSISFKERKIVLNNMEFMLLTYFVGNENIVLSRLRILEDVWGLNAFTRTNTVDVHVCMLRKKLKYLTGENLIRAVYCSGYVFSRPFAA